jgi:hypothetical protein
MMNWLYIKLSEMFGKLASLFISLSDSFYNKATRRDEIRKHADEILSVCFDGVYNDIHPSVKRSVKTTAVRDEKGNLNFKKYDIGLEENNEESN